MPIIYVLLCLLNKVFQFLIFKFSDFQIIPCLATFTQLKMSYNAHKNF